MEPAFLAFEHVGLTYSNGSNGSNGVEALHDVSFRIRRGEFVALIGPSGSGKSSILRLAGGLLLPTSGRITIEGQPVSGPHERAGYVFQEPVLLPWRSVLDNVALPLEIMGIGRAERRQRASGLLELAGIAEFAAAYPGQLSGGMQQRAAIARALAHNPDFLLMDEPFNALDAISRELFNLELLRIWQQSRKTILFVTHQISEAVLLADRVIVLGPRPGSIIGQIPVELPRPRTTATPDLPVFNETNAQIRALLLAAMTADARIADRPYTGDARTGATDAA